MDKQGAQRLVERIEREPGWQAETSYNVQAGAWAVKAWSVGGGNRQAPDATLTTPYDWYYFQARLTTTLQRAKAWRLTMRKSMRESARAGGRKAV